MNTKQKTKFKNYKTQKGAVSVEYAILLSSLAIMVIMSKQGLEKETAAAYQETSNFLAYNYGATTTPTPPVTPPPSGGNPVTPPPSGGDPVPPPLPSPCKPKKKC